MPGFPEDEIDRIAENLTKNEVHYCVSALVYDLMQTPEEAEELREVCVQDDWTSAAFEEVANESDPDKLSEVRSYIEENDLAEQPENIGQLDARALADLVSEDEDTAREFCEAFDIEPQQDEALEHWIVSDRLADDLEECGGMVLRNWHGLTIWGRTTTGQGIAMDGIMRRVAELVKARAEEAAGR